MSGRRAQLVAAVDELGRRDPVIAALREEHGPPHLASPAPVASRFATLARSILYQQLAGTAARAIHGRFVESLGGSVTPALVLAAGPQALAACGLSRAKAAALVDLAERVSDGRLTLEHLGRMPDDEVIAQLVSVRGIGTWTAHMFLLSSLGRLDVWPVGDLGVRTGFAVAWGLADQPTPGELELLGEPFRPWRSVVAWYCWRAADAGRATATPLGIDPSPTKSASSKRRATRPPKRPAQLPTRRPSKG
jgi:DNA-3-methyladenine glycosylase II